MFNFHNVTLNLTMHLEAGTVSGLAAYLSRVSRLLGDFDYIDIDDGNRIIKIGYHTEDTSSAVFEN